jgi:hypothetical protein
MKEKVPSVGKFIDEEEEALHALIEIDSHVPGPSLLTPERLNDLRKSTTQQRSPEEQAWVNGAAVGREIL